MSAGFVLFESCEGEFVPCFFPSFSWFPGDLWHFLASATSPHSLPSSLRGLLPLCVSVYVSEISFFIRMSHIELETTLMTSSKCDYLQRPNLQIRSHSQVLGVRILTSFVETQFKP